jgi:hypothetical protein
MRRMRRSLIDHEMNIKILKMQRKADKKTSFPYLPYSLLTGSEYFFV